MPSRRAKAKSPGSGQLRLPIPHTWGGRRPDTPLLETFVRVSLVYLLLVLIADAVQNGMAGQYQSVANALVAREFVGLDELLAQLRQQGVERPEDVRLAVMESDGRVSVLPREPAPPHRRPPDPPLA